MPVFACKKLPVTLQKHRIIMHPNERRREAAALLLQGLSPSQIAGRMHLPLGAVMNYLYNQVGQGTLRRSDILFSFPEETRRSIEEAIERSGGSAGFPQVRRQLRQAGLQISRGDLEIYLNLRDSRVALGDMYELVRDIELRLHDVVRKSLIAQYGEEHWWRKG